MSKRIFIYSLFIFAFLFQAHAQTEQKLPIVKSNIDKISIKDGEILKKNNWNLAPEAKPDIYQTSVRKGAKKKITFITDIDQISFEIEAGKTYDFIIHICRRQRFGV